MTRKYYTLRGNVLRIRWGGGVSFVNHDYFLKPAVRRLLQCFGDVPSTSIGSHVCVLFVFGAKSGTGKTLLAKAAATETGATFIELKISDVVRGEVGESEKV